MKKIKTHFRQKKDNTKQQEARRRVPPLRPGPALRSRARRGRVFEIHAGAPRVPHHPHLGRREFFLNFFCQVLLFSLEEREREREGERKLTLFPPPTPPHHHHHPPPPPQDQLLYGCNVLNLGNSKIISVHAGTARQIVRDPRFRGDVQVVDFSPITSMYGAVHCSSQVVKRTPASAAM